MSENFDVQDYLVPERVLKRVFDLVNQVRNINNLSPLIFSKELSFIAGEHAVNMSTLNKNFGHEEFIMRESQIPMATSFSENIACLPVSEDPAKDIVFYWIKKSTCFSRILSDFTHTGIGVAESEDGLWYCTQIFSTFKSKLSLYDHALIIQRFINRYRDTDNKVFPHLSAIGTMINMSTTSADDLSMLDSSSACDLFHCKEAKVIKFTLPTRTDILLKFMENIKTNAIYMDIITNKVYNCYSFSIHRTVIGSQQQCTLIMMKSKMPVRKLPTMYKAFPQAAKFLAYINDLRKALDLHPMVLSLQWCKIADQHCHKMLVRSSELCTSSISKRLSKMFPGSLTYCTVGICPYVPDPIPDFVMKWVNSVRSYKSIINPDYTHLGFSALNCENKILYSALIVGKKVEALSGHNTNKTIPEENYCLDPTDKHPLFVYCRNENTMEEETLTRDASASFKLIG